VTPSAIFKALETQLKNSSDLSYVDDTHIFVGKRTNITNYPVIVIEPAGDRVVSRTYPYEDIIQKVVVAGGLKVYDENKQIVGDVSVKGIIDFKNDIKKALCSDNTLAGACIDLNIIDSQDDNAEDYPVRGFAINVEILFRQNAVTRA